MPVSPPSARVRRVLRLALHALCAMPALLLLLATLRGDLGVNPVETLLHTAGIWSLRLLLICLCVTPLHWLLKAPWLVTYRRALGDWAFFYVCLHLSIYLVFDAELDFSYVFEDIAERPYITMGMTGFLLLLPLAVTSNHWSQRKLGRNWKRLHRLVYLAAIAACVHFLWLVKGFQIEPLVYATILALLLGVRWVRHLRQRG